jgi:RNA polymerase sigma-70 factor (ECF subfamily)
MTAYQATSQVGLCHAALKSDEQLIAETAADPAAFGVFYERHIYTVLAVVRSRVPMEVAFDITAEVFAIALKSSNRFRDRGKGSALAWIIGIARIEIADHGRMAARDMRAVRRLGMTRVDLTDAEIRALEARVDARRTDVMIHLRDLPEHERLAVFEYIVQEREYGSIADRHGISEAAVRKRVSRALASLRRQWGKETQL